MRNIILSGLLLVCANSYAVTCTSGCNDVYLKIEQNLASNENDTGAQINSNAVTTPALGMQATHNGYLMQWAKFNGDPIPAPPSHATNWQFKKVDDYISVALSRDSPCIGNTGTIYVPFNERVYGKGCEAIIYQTGNGMPITPRDWQSRLRIDRKIVSGTYSKNILIGQFGFCQPDNCTSPQVVQNVYLSLNITVPQTCSINAGQTVIVDFGNISTGAFKTAGARAQNINPKESTLSVTCDNIASGTNLNMRLQANNVAGNIVISDNSDVGFIVTDSSDKELTPNSLSSFIPFSLDGNTRANARIRVYPASVTGIRPDEGPVASQAYLRIDFP
ncbi:fimbrial protein [Morganella morganii]|uniref:fimbrial protein n=1 Tax=Morganella morganii TaxID=582 RepID=UPI001BD94DCA|nr:fimbrial protein [Morganella morganii]ELT0455201.1 fimbrial protein [Morganella morganii]ELT0456109.1 fimbrial protein [Morganella morganii]MBT0338652.1 fimbrial protein [Morganella morganii subsp. morganii]